MRTLILTSAIALLGLTSTAEAHFVLMSPAPTNPADTTQGKGGLPCGPDMAMAATPTAAQGGHTILLKLVETVPHNGFYRVALSINSRTEIPLDNVVYDASKPPKILSPNGPAGTSASAAFESPPFVFPVLADNLFPHMGTGMMTFMANIMLPNVNCDHCTMQVIEFMWPHGYNGTPGLNNGGGYFYHHCADLKITADPAMPIFTPGTDGGAPDSSTSTGGTSGTGTAGTSGATGTGGTGGSSTSGTAGSGSTGSGGGEAGTTSTTGTAGSTGAAGQTTGAAGNGGTTSTGTGSGAGGTTTRGSSGGCSLALNENSGSAAPWVIIGLGLLTARGRRRRLRR
jgi:hypothetical protein